MKKQELIKFLNSKFFSLDAEVTNLLGKQEKYKFILDILKQEHPFVQEEYLPGCPPYEDFNIKIKEEDFSEICKLGNCNHCWQLFIMKLLEE